VEEKGCQVLRVCTLAVERRRKKKRHPTRGFQTD